MKACGLNGRYVEYRVVARRRPGSSTSGGIRPAADAGHGSHADICMSALQQATHIRRNNRGFEGPAYCAIAGFFRRDRLIACPVDESVEQWVKQ